MRIFHGTLLVLLSGALALFGWEIARITLTILGYE